MVVQSRLKINFSLIRGSTDQSKQETSSGLSRLFFAVILITSQVGMKSRFIDIIHGDSLFMEVVLFNSYSFPKYINVIYLAL